MKNRRRTPPPNSADGFLDAWDWDHIPVDVRQVMDTWRRLVRRRHPWCAMPQDDASGSMRIVISELLNEAREPYDDRRADRLRNALRDHADFRRRQHLGSRLVADEIDALKRAIDAALRESGASPLLVGDIAIVFGAELDSSSPAAFEAGSP